MRAEPRVPEIADVECRPVVERDRDPRFVAFAFVPARAAFERRDDPLERHDPVTPRGDRHEVEPKRDVIVHRVLVPQNAMRVVRQDDRVAHSLTGARPGTSAEGKAFGPATENAQAATAPSGTTELLIESPEVGEDSVGTPSTLTELPDASGNTASARIRIIQGFQTSTGGGVFW